MMKKNEKGLVQNLELFVFVSFFQAAGCAAAGAAAPTAAGASPPLDATLLRSLALPPEK